MASVMEKKRARTQAAIIAAARHLISRDGFEETSMEAIAAQAEIATGTLYNYYGSKSVLLVALYANLTERLLKEIPQRTTGAITADTALKDLIAVLQYFSHSVRLFPKAVTRQIYAFMYVLEPETIATLTSMDMEIISLMVPILEDMSQAGLLARELSIDETAMLLYGSSMMQHQAYIMMVDMTELQLSDAIASQVKMQFHGLLPR